MNTQTRLLAAVLLAGAAGAALAKPYCGELNNAYGPFDYRVADQNTKDLVEHAHFTEEVEAGQAGHTSYIGADIDYTLRVFPNHPRALATMIRLTRRGGANSYTLTGAHYPTECYFERAVRWQADDAAAWSLYAQYLYTIGKDGQAMPMLQKAVELDPDNPTYNYNLGLVYAKKKQYDLALPLGQKAYAQGFPLPGLKQMLVKAGKWVEPPPAAAPAAVEEQAAPASQPAAATAEASSKP
ncbi:tetratricopeptide repeat protein [Pseudoduganella eburnea]|uniref:Tetratricopeptide repeat protein n=1 Tax=Massilia eburnea TaxID=1776165 RepID=A0A6L6QRL8_9BURK|nr:tetratricopeptide repeat protein [Massilia eburnea]MTW14286.1 tetratricopeptide repeat protein [Massilia eburnea]